MSFVNPSDAERAMMERVNAVGQRLAAAAGDEQAKVVAVAISIWFEHNPELSTAFAELCQDFVLPLVLRNTISISKSDQALKAALRRVR